MGEQNWWTGTITRALIFNIFSGVMVFLAILIAAALGKNIASHNFWFDESGQYWIAMGQNHFSPAGTPDGSLRDVWIQSKTYIADPGGFTLLLRCLVKGFGSAPATLRLAPVFFGALFLYAIYHWSKRLGMATPIAIAISASFLMLENTVTYMMELRPYSMELCGALVLGMATIFLLEKPGWKSLLLWIGLDWLFTLSRYSFIVYSVSACTLLALSAWKRKTHQKIFATAIAAAAAGSMLVYIGMLRFQSSDASPPYYVSNLMLANQNLQGAAATLQHNFLDSATLGKTFFLLAMAIALALGRRSRFAGAVTRPDSVFIWTAGYIVFADLGWLALSAAGKMPWDAVERWSLSEYGLSALALPALFALVWTYIRDRKWLQANAVHIGSTFLLCLLCLKVEVDSMRFSVRYDRDLREPDHLSDALNAAACRHSGGSILLDRGLWADYRYLTERSGLKLLCGENSHVKTASTANLSDFAAQGVAMPRPVTFIFGSWDRKANGALLAKLKGVGETEAVSYGYLDFTHSITLN